MQRLNAQKFFDRLRMLNKCINVCVHWDRCTRRNVAGCIVVVSLVGDNINCPCDIIAH